MSDTNRRRNIKYKGAAPGAGETITLMSTLEQGMDWGPAGAGFYTFVLGLSHDEDVTINAYAKKDSGSDWVLIESRALLASESPAIQRFDIEAYNIWELRATTVNEQTVWEPFLAFSNVPPALWAEEVNLEPYTRTDGTKPFTGVVAGIDPTAALHLTTQQWVEAQIAASTHLTPPVDPADDGKVAYAASADLAYATYVKVGADWLSVKPSAGTAATEGAVRLAGATSRFEWTDYGVTARVNSVNIPLAWAWLDGGARWIGRGNADARYIEDRVAADGEYRVHLGAPDNSPWFYVSTAAVRTQAPRVEVDYLSTAHAYFGFETLPDTEGSGNYNTYFHGQNLSGGSPTGAAGDAYLKGGDMLGSAASGDEAGGDAYVIPGVSGSGASAGGQVFIGDTGTSRVLYQVAAGKRHDFEVDGTEAGSFHSGGLYMEGLSITGVNEVDGVDVSDHHARHEASGADEMDLAGMTGLLGTPQTPAAHALTHKGGGADAIANVTALLAGLMAAADKVLFDAIPTTYYAVGGDQLEGNMDVNGHDLTDVGISTSKAPGNTASSGGDITLDFTASNIAETLLTEDIDGNFTLNTPPGSGRARCQWTVKQAASGGPYDLSGSWPAAVKWVDSVVPTMPTGAGEAIVMTWVWSGTYWRGSFSGTFSA